MSRHKIIVMKVRVRPVDAIDLFGLSGRKLLVRIEAQTVGQQPLASQDLVNSRDATRVLMVGIEERGIAIRHLCRGRKERSRNCILR